MSTIRDKIGNLLDTFPKSVWVIQTPKYNQSDMVMIGQVPAAERVNDDPYKQDRAIVCLATEHLALEIRSRLPQQMETKVLTLEFEDARSLAKKLGSSLVHLNIKGCLIVKEDGAQVMHWVN